MAYDIICVGGSVEDITVYTSEGILIDNKNDLLRQRLLAFEFGAKLRVDKAYSTFGGGSANASVCVSRLGLNTACFTNLGDDERSQRIIRNFKTHKVKTTLLKRSIGKETGFSFIVVGQNSEHVAFVNRAANNELRVDESDLKKLEKTKWIYMTSLDGKWQAVLQSIFRLNWPKIAWNPGQTQLAAGTEVIGRYLKKTDILILNKDEALELAVSDKGLKKKGRKFLENTDNLIKAVYSFGAKLVVLTEGDKGAIAFDGEKMYKQKAYKFGKPVDTTGVGDSFGSSFVAGMHLYNNDIKQALGLAASNSASVVGEQGAQNGLLSVEEINKLKL